MPAFVWAVRRFIRRSAVASAVCLLPVSLAVSKTAWAQDAPPLAVAQDTCSFEESKAFERRSTPWNWIATKFIAKPDPNADGGQIRRHFIFSHILGKFAATTLYKSSFRRCFFGHMLDASFDLYFELFTIGQNVHDECSLNRCARWLSDLLQSAVIDQQAFSTTVESIVEGIRRSDSPNPRYLRLGVRRATQEAYRHIYPAGTKERILVDLSSQDFLDSGFDEFVAWFRNQQSALRGAFDGRELTRRLPPSGQSIPMSQTEDGYCAASPDLSVQELNINNHGWGQRAIILINHAYKRDGVAGIGNSTLRAICHPNDKNLDPLDTWPWSEMAGQISCSRERLNRDRWLILFSKNELTETGANMRRYAQEIAETLRADRCVHPELRIFVVNFLQQR
jgi:hypothetical protein